MVLPTTVTQAEAKPPSNLVLISHAGCGKTSATSCLPNCLLIDLQDGAGSFSNMRVNIKGIAALENKHEGQVLMETLAEIKKANAAKGDFVYDFIAFDTISDIEGLAETRATMLFNNSAMGKAMAQKNGKFLKDVISELAGDGFSPGYRWFHMAFDEIYQACKGLAKHGVIFLGHVKQGSMMKDGEKLEAKDMDLTGKLKRKLLGDCQAAGYLYRNSSNRNQVMVSFKSNERDLFTKARVNYLADKEFLLSEMSEDGSMLTVYWNNIYPTWIKEPIQVKQV